LQDQRTFAGYGEFRNQGGVTSKGQNDRPRKVKAAQGRTCEFQELKRSNKTEESLQEIMGCIEREQKQLKEERKEIFMRESLRVRMRFFVGIMSF
jgi:hypothetical protein